MLNMFQIQPRFAGLVSFAARKTTYRMGTSISVILLDTVNNLGEKGNVVNVKRGPLTHSLSYLRTNLLTYLLNILTHSPTHSLT